MIRPPLFFSLEDQMVCTLDFLNFIHEPCVLLLRGPVLSQRNVAHSSGAELVMEG